MIGKRKFLGNDNQKQTKKKWQLEIENSSRNSKKSTLTSFLNSLSSDSVNTNTNIDNSISKSSINSSFNDSILSSTSSNLPSDYSVKSSIETSNFIFSYSSSQNSLNFNNNSLLLHKITDSQQYPIKNIKDDSETDSIDDPLCIQLSEQDLEKLKEEDDDDDYDNNDYHDKNSINTTISLINNDSIIKDDQIFNISENNLSNVEKKKKRYAWMDSEDEELLSNNLSGDDDEDDDNQIDSNHSTIDKNHLNNDLDDNCDTFNYNLIPFDCQNTNDKDQLNNRNVLNNNTLISLDNSVSGHNVLTSKILFDHSNESINKNIRKSIKRDDNDIYEAVRFAYVSNICWDSKLSDLKTWIEKNAKQKVLSIIPDNTAPQSTLISSYSNPITSSSSSFSSSSIQSFCLGTSAHSSSTHYLNNSKSEFDHKGRAYVEFISYQALQSALALNEKPFMGRIVRIIKAYRRNNQFYLLQTPAHYRFFHNVANMNSSKTKKKVHKMDGGFNWAK